jgi:hypothetical protein
MTFTVALDGAPLEGILRYIEAEYSFTFDVSSPADLRARSGAAGVTSLSVGTLQIEVAVETGLVLFVWGLHPRSRWKVESVAQPNPAALSARVKPRVPLERGVTAQISPVGAWETYFDDTTGWARVAKNQGYRSEQEVLVATGIVLGITGHNLDSLWLQPIFE